MCIFLSPNAIQVPVCIPQGQVVSSPRLPVPPTSKPGQNVLTSPVSQPPVLPDSTQGSTSIPSPSPISAALPSTSSVTTVSAIPTSSGIPPGSTLVLDPQQLGLLRSPSLGSQFVNQQIVGTTLDGKTVTLQGSLPPYYQTVPASLVGSLPTQSVASTSGVQSQVGVGNGLLVTAVGIVPGVNPPGMVYASQLSEMAQKQGLETGSDAVVQPDAGPPTAKRSKLDGQ